MSHSPISFADGVDLHAHTSASDGSLSPTELVRKAASLGLRAIAVTDHDTIGGLLEARGAAESLGAIEFVPGVELSTEDDTGRFHMLGYLFDQDNAELAETLEELRARRAARNVKIMAKVREYSLPLTWDDVMAEVKEGGEVVGRPHIAAAMLKNGIVQTRQEAFDKWLAMGAPLYFSKGGLTPADAAALLHRAGGISVMAHPALTKWADPAALEPYLATLKQQGIDGLEVYYSQHSPEQIEAYGGISDRLGLVKTGGSDFHGDPKPHVPLGIAAYGGAAPYSVLEGLKAYKAGR
jgi:3',5'-nucleoside bisphosphate phosphatase